MTRKKFVDSSKNAELEVHAHDAGQHDRRQEDRGQQRERLHDVVGMLRDPAHVDVVGPQERFAGTVDGLHGAFQSVDEAGPRLADGLLDPHLRPRQRREGVPVRREGPADEPDPSTHRHDLLQHVEIASTAERPLIKDVDIVLQPLGELEVADEHLVDERRQQVGGVELADPGLARDALGEAVDRLDRPVVHGDDQVPAGQKVDLAADEASVVIGFQRLEDEVDPVGLAAQLGPALGTCDPLRVPVAQPGVARERIEFVGGTPVQVDPEKLVALQAGDGLRPDLDVAVLAVPLEQPTLDGAQRTDASSSAPTTAITATPYCKTSMPRSEPTAMGAPDGSSMVWVVMRCASLSTWGKSGYPGACIVVACP